MSDREVTEDLIEEGWYRRCAEDPTLTDHLGARNAIAALLDYIEDLTDEMSVLNARLHPEDRIPLAEVLKEVESRRTSNPSSEQGAARE